MPYLKLSIVVHCEDYRLDYFSTLTLTLLNHALNQQMPIVTLNLGN